MVAGHLLRIRFRSDRDGTGNARAGNAMHLWRSSALGRGVLGSRQHATNLAGQGPRGEGRLRKIAVVWAT